jgi:hypothetical protein
MRKSTVNTDVAMVVGVLAYTLFVICFPLSGNQ